MTRYLRLGSHRSARMSLLVGIAAAGFLAGGSALAQGAGTAGSAARPGVRSSGPQGVDTRVNAHADKAPLPAEKAGAADAASARPAGAATAAGPGGGNRPAGASGASGGGTSGTGTSSSSTSSTSGGTNTMR